MPRFVGVGRVVLADTLRAALTVTVSGQGYTGQIVAALLQADPNNAGFMELLDQVLATPAQPTVANIGTAGSTSYSYRIVALKGTAVTLPSTVRTTTTGNATLDTTNFNRITWTAVAGATGYRVYRTASAGTPSSTGIISTIVRGDTLTLDDTGLAGDSGSVPTVNNTSNIMYILQPGQDFPLNVSPSQHMQVDLTELGVRMLNANDAYYLSYWR